jgi:hypothetical protein
MRAAEENVLTPGMRSARRAGVHPAIATILFPAFTAARERTAIGTMGNRIQLQQRNCFRFSRNSFQTATNKMLAKN